MKAIRPSNERMEKMDTLPETKSAQLRQLYFSGYHLTGAEEFYEDLPGLFTPAELVRFRNSKDFRGNNLEWSKSPLKTAQASGYMMGMNRRFIESETSPTLDEYWKHYKEHYNQIKAMREQGHKAGVDFIDMRPEESFIDYIERWTQYWTEYHPKNFSLSASLTEWFLHIVIQSYEGMIGEMMVIAWLKERTEGLKKYAGYEDNDVIDVIESPSELDWTYNSDILITRNGEPIFSIQVKPRSYFHNSNKYYQREKDNHQRKDMMLKKRFGLNQYYIDKDTIIKQDYPTELILGTSLVLHRTETEEWNSIIEDGQGGFRRIKAHRMTPPQYKGYPY